MARAQDSFGKREKEKKRLKKKQEKENKRQERKANSKKGEGFDQMIAYVDEFGQITDTPPDPTKKVEIELESIEIGISKQVVEEVDPIKKGKIDFFNESKGYGFIKEDQTNESYFVHVNGLVDEVNEGDKVTFELERGLKGMNAVNVKKA